MLPPDYDPRIWRAPEVLVCESNAGYLAFVAGPWAALFPPISRDDRGLLGILPRALWTLADWLPAYIAREPDCLILASATEDWLVVAERTATWALVLYPAVMGRSASLFVLGEDV